MGRRHPGGARHVTATTQAFLDANRAAAADPARDSAAGGACVPCRFAQRRVRIVLKDADFLICRYKRYLLEVGGERFSGNTGEPGTIDHLVPQDAVSGTLSVWMDDEADEPLAWKLDIAPIDPLALDSGAQARFGNLEFDVPGDGEAWKTALEGFQELFGMEKTGQLDGSTQSALRELYSAREAPDAMDAQLKWQEWLRDAVQDGPIEDE